MTREIWTGEDELAFQMGDMNGMAFNEEADVRGCDKPHHVARSIFHQPNHLKHIKSVPAIPMRLPEVMKKHIKRNGKK